MDYFWVTLCVGNHVNVGRNFVQDHEGGMQPKQRSVRC